MVRLPEPDPASLAAAQAGQLAALETLLRSLEPGLYNLAVRMLGHREDARDACQEILLKILTHLGGFRGASAFSTWAYQIARNHLLTASTRARERPETSLESLAERLDHGLAFAERVGPVADLTPEDKAAARETAVTCTQGMLMSLDREERLTYLLNTVFGLTSEQAAAVLEIDAATYRKRLSRVRGKLAAFQAKTCGLVSATAACRCEKQLPAKRYLAESDPASQSRALTLSKPEREQAERAFDRLLVLEDSAALFRAHPEYQVPAALSVAIRSILRREGYWREPS